MGNVGMEFGIMRKVSNSAKQTRLSFSDQEMGGSDLRGKGENGVYILHLCKVMWICTEHSCDGYGNRAFGYYRSFNLLVRSVWKIYML